MSRTRLILGLMSGTSHDGTDAVIAKFTLGGGPSRPVPVFHAHTPHPAALRRDIRAAFNGATLDVCTLNFALGEAFARAAISCAIKAGIDMGRIAAIASHGQTICHVPRARGRPGSTLQIGEPSVIARRTLRPVISNFRGADIAAGGQGAPLVPFADWVMFHRAAPVAIHNLGGISNLTVVTPGLDDVYAFDTGAGNCLMDEAAQLYLHKPFDRGGAAARKGRPDAALLAALMRMPYLKARPPKSTGRELFNLPMAMKLLGRRRLAPQDMLSTLAHFTAQSLAQAYRQFVLPCHALDEIVFAGGGTSNSFLMQLIADALPELAISTTERYGIASEAREALCFCVLANETLSGRPSNLPRATGACQRVILGSLTLP